MAIRDQPQHHSNRQQQLGNSGRVESWLHHLCNPSKEAVAVKKSNSCCKSLQPTSSEFLNNLKQRHSSSHQGVNPIPHPRMSSAISDSIGGRSESILSNPSWEPWKCRASVVCCRVTASWPSGKGIQALWDNPASFVEFCMICLGSFCRQRCQCTLSDLWERGMGLGTERHPEA